MAEAQTKRVPAEVFPVGQFVREEMDARDWSIGEMARRMGGTDHDRCVLELILYLDDPSMRLDRSTAEKIAKAFGTDVELWLNLDEQYRAYAAERVNAWNDPAALRARAEEIEKGSVPHAAT